MKKLSENEMEMTSGGQVQLPEVKIVAYNILGMAWVFINGEFAYVEPW